MPVGSFTWFNQAKLKLADPGLLVASNTFKAVLCSSAQVLGATFNGSSGDCRYADLTAELATANGYTVGGVSLSNVAMTRTAGVVKWTADPWLWTITGAGVTAKYLVLFDDTLANDPLVCFVDLDTGGGSLVVAAGAFQITPNASGILNWT